VLNALVFVCIKLLNITIPEPIDAKTPLKNGFNSGSETAVDGKSVSSF